MTSATPSIRDYLDAYPYPAFILHRKQHLGLHPPSLEPFYTNSAYQSLFLGRQDPANLSGWLDALHTAEQAQRFAEWLMPNTPSASVPSLGPFSSPSSVHDPSIIELDITLKWTSSPASVTLQFLKTALDTMWVITSIPLPSHPLPSPPPVEQQDTSRRSTVARRRGSPELTLPDFPPRSNLATSTDPPLASTINHGSPNKTSFKPHHSVTDLEYRSLEIEEEMRIFVDRFPWEKTSLGPQDKWPQSLKTAWSIMWDNPYPSALWWGKEFTVLYNPAYAASVAGKKHPRIFAGSGAVAWGEIWEKLGPQARSVDIGHAVGAVDDQLFFDRLTDELLPEEVYHSWSWVPIMGEDGKLAGLMNNTIETTAKVIASRRLACLRHLCERSALASTTKQYASTILDVFTDNQYEAPFAAVYSCSSPVPVAKPASKPAPSGAAMHVVALNNDDAIIHLPTSHSLNFTKQGSIGTPELPGGTTHNLLPKQFTVELEPSSSRLSSHTSSAGTRQDDQGNRLSVASVGETSSPLLTEALRKPITSSTLEPLTSSPLTTSLLTSSASTPPLTNSTPTNSMFRPTLDNARTTSNGSNSISEASSSYSDTVQPARSTHSGSTTSLSSFDWTFWVQEAFRTRKAVLATLPPEMVVDVGKDRGWHDRVREAVVIPISTESEGGSSDMGVIILGVNTRTPYGSEYAEWIDVMRMTLSSALTAVVGRESETIRADQLAQLDAAKTSFFSNASHEFRTPLTLISGPLNDAIAIVEDRGVKEKLQLAARNVSRLTRLVDSLMDFSRLEGGKLAGRFRPVMLGPLTEDLTSLFRSTIEKSSIEYRVECDVKELRPIFIDPDLYEKIVFNLIGNAYKYTLEGTITVKLVFSDNWATLSVSDTGVGVPAEDLDRIFERFHRVQATSRSHEGTGIGLSLVKELVKLHGGHLSVRSVTAAASTDGSHGSTFTVNLPFGMDHLPRSALEESQSTVTYNRAYARGMIDEASQWGRSTDASTPSDSSDSDGSVSLGSLDSTTIFFQKTDIILLADDNTDMRQYIKSIFAPFCTVIEAADGQQALDILKSGVRPHIIVSDVMMPVLDGFGLLAAVRASPEFRGIPVVLVTAQAGDEARLEGLLNGADDYIPKPFTAKQLVARTHLQMQMGKRKAELEARFEASTRELRALSELAPVGIFRADMNRHLTYSNHTWHSIVGVPKDASLDDWIDNVVPSDLSAVEEAWSCAFRDHEPQMFELTFTNGRYVQMSIGILDDPIGGLYGVMGTVTDLTELKTLQAAQLAHAEERETAARRKAEDAEERRIEAEDRRRAQELLIDVTSHELRQPVSAVINCASLVRTNLTSLREQLDQCVISRATFAPTREVISVIDEDLEALDAIYQCGLSQERIANDVLSLSRMQLEVLSIVPVEFDLTAEVRRICSLFTTELNMKHIHFLLTVGESLQRLGISHIRLDKARFAQIVTNLLSNAIKFTDVSPSSKRYIHLTLDASYYPPSVDTCLPPPLSLSLQAHSPHVYVFMSVKDSGPGLKPSDLALLFQRFAQGSNSHEVFGGSGLGLFVSRKLCELMGGRIEVTSEYGQGATFRFFLQSDVVVTPQLVASPAAQAVRTPSRSLRVLITEDNQINQTVLNRQLKKAGCETVLANNGVEAINAMKSAYGLVDSKVASGAFDVILMDCEMPVMNGYDAVREIRKMEADGVLPHRNFIIALTGNARSAQVQSARDAGMDDVMIKPYKINDLLERMQQRPSEPSG